MDILSKLIIFLIRMKLHLRKGEQFQFDNQKTEVSVTMLLSWLRCGKWFRRSSWTMRKM